MPTFELSMTINQRLRVCILSNLLCDGGKLLKNTRRCTGEPYSGSSCCKWDWGRVGPGRTKAFENRGAKYNIIMHTKCAQKHYVPEATPTNQMLLVQFILNFDLVFCATHSHLVKKTLVSKPAMLGLGYTWPVSDTVVIGYHWSFLKKSTNNISFSPLR